MKFKVKMREKLGITLISLVITIVVLLILSSIAIAGVTGNNGIIKNANKAKEQAQIAEEKEMVGSASIQAISKNQYGNIEENELQEQLNKISGNKKAEVTDIGEEFEVLFKESKRYYTVDKQGNVNGAFEIVEDKYPGDITVGKNGETLDGNTKETAYEIWCIEDLVAFSNMVDGTGIRLVNREPVEINVATDFYGKYVILKTNLNFKSKLSYQNSERTDFGDINGIESDSNTLINEMTTGTGFKPIGRDNAFAGNFDGQNPQTKDNYIISNIYINSATYAGLFGQIEGNVTIENIEISGNIKGKHTGGIIGETTLSTYTAIISNCINKSNIEGYNMVGGIIGFCHGNNVTIRKCKNYGNIIINGKDWTYAGIGGIIGANKNEYNKQNVIESCENYGIIGEENCTIVTGGIIGCINSVTKLTECNNYGEVISNTTTGGIIGVFRVGIENNIYNNSNYGDIKGAGAGGIIGGCDLAAYDLTSNQYIENCYNIGQVEAKNNAGGIIGRVGGYAYKELNVYVNNCYNKGKLLGLTTGGVIGSISNNAKGIKAQYLYLNKAYYYIAVASNGIGRGNADEGETIVIEDVNTQDFVNTLNNYTDENNRYPINWKKWKLGEEGYPIFE